MLINKKKVKKKYLSFNENKKSAKIDKYLDFTRELRKLRNMRVTVILIVFGALGTVSESLERRLKELEIGGQIEVISIVKIVNNNESHGDLRKLDATPRKTIT